MKKFNFNFLFLENISVKSTPRKVPVPGPPPSVGIPKTNRCSRTKNNLPAPPPPPPDSTPPPPDSAPITVKEEVYSVQELEENFCPQDNAIWMGHGTEEASISNTSDVHPSGDESSLDAGSAFGEDDTISNEDSGSDFEEEKVKATSGIQTRRSTRNSTKSKPNDYIQNESSGSENEEGEDEEQDYINENDDENDSSNNNSDNYEDDDNNTSDEEFELPRTRSKKSDTKSSPTKRRRMTNATPSNEFECHICSVKILAQRAVAYHYLKEHPTHKKYTCRFCQKHFRKLLDCLTHQRNKHTGEKPFKCPSCTSAFAAKKLLKSHIILIHTDSNYPCTKCNREIEFPTRTLLNNHLASVHGHQFKKKIKKSRAKHPPKTWICNICSTPITGYASFLQHYADDHPDEKRYTCKFCKKYFNRYRECARHQLLHTGERPLKCDICSKNYRDTKALRHHQRHVHREGPTTYHICPTCGKQFTNTSALHYHMYSHSEAMIFCKLCGNHYKNPGYFARHNKKAHEGKAECSEPIQNPTKEILQSLGIPELEAKLVKCHLCWSSFPNRILLKKHFTEEHPDHQGGLNTCHCGKEFQKYKECCRHAIRHNGTKTFQCDQCPMLFYSVTETRLHAQSHIPVEERKNHICDICGLGLVTESGLISHKKTHDANQPRWVCEQCGKSYSRKKGLIYHTKIEHLKVTPFQCTKCGKAFAVKNDLAKHERSHSKVRPYKCSLCDKCFPYTSSRTRHLREVHKVEGDTKRMEETGGRVEEEIPEVESKPDIIFGEGSDTLAL